jgi:WXG100 family type VII secretion target
MGSRERGGIVDEMRDMARLFSRNSERLGEILRDLNTRTVESDRIWKGPAADRFRSEWSEARSVFERMQRSLGAASTAVDKSAENLERATN